MVVETSRSGKKYLPWLCIRTVIYLAKWFYCRNYAKTKANYNLCCKIREWNIPSHITKVLLLCDIYHFWEGTVPNEKMLQSNSFHPTDNDILVKHSAPTKYQSISQCDSTPCWCDLVIRFLFRSWGGNDGDWFEVYIVVHCLSVIVSLRPSAATLSTVCCK